MSNRQISKRRFGRVTVDPAYISKVFAERREALGMSLRQVAAKADVALGTAQSFEQGDYTIRLDTFLKLLASVDLLPTNVLKIDGQAAAPETLTLDQELRRLALKKDASELLHALANLLKKASKEV